MNAGGILFEFSNIGIFCGYLVIGFIVLPRTTEFIRRLVPFVVLHLKWTLTGGVGFFALCGLTHLEMAMHYALTPNETIGHNSVELHMILIHVLQVIAVWTLIGGSYLEFVLPITRALTTKEEVNSGTGDS